MPVKILKWLVAAAIALAVLVLGGGYLLSPKFTVTRSTLVNAPAEKVYGFVASPRAWKQWAVWNQRDPDMKISYSGPEQGTGAKWSWESKSQGNGSMTLTRADPPHAVDFDLYFVDFDTTSKGELSFSPEGNATRVTWTMDGDMGASPVSHWFALFADQMIGKDFEAGLAGLKTLAEKPNLN